MKNLTWVVRRVLLEIGVIGNWNYLFWRIRTDFVWYSLFDGLREGEEEVDKPDHHTDQHEYHLASRSC